MSLAPLSFLKTSVILTPYFAQGRGRLELLPAVTGWGSGTLDRSGVNPIANRQTHSRQHLLAIKNNQLTRGAWLWLVGGGLRGRSCMYGGNTPTPRRKTPSGTWTGTLLPLRVALTWNKASDGKRETVFFPVWLLSGKVGADDPPDLLSFRRSQTHWFPKGESDPMENILSRIEVDVVKVGFAHLLF